MKITHASADFTVFDDVLDMEAFQSLWKAVQSLRYDFSESEWMRLWPLADPQPAKSGPFAWSARPCGFGLDQYIERFVELIGRPDSCLADASGWEDVAFRVFLHARGSRMVAHSDTPKYMGAGVFYAHPVWQTTWGGELCFPRLDASLDTRSISVEGESFTNSPINAAIEEYGMATTIAPRPNRLVLIRGGVVHSTNRVDPDAGAAIRCSITSFLIPVARDWNQSARQTFELD